MRLFSYCGLFCVSLSVALAAPGPQARSFDYKLKETITAPRGWVKHGVPPADHKIVLRIGLPQPNFSELEKHLYEISDPEHTRYGAHLSKEEVEALVAPHPESIDAIDEWLSLHGFGEEDVTRSPAKDWVTLTVPVAVAEKMLGTTYNVWKHAESGDYIVRTTSYSLPEHIHDHVDVIQPTTMFGQFKRMKSTIFWPSKTDISEVAPANVLAAAAAKAPGAVDPSCNTTITISCLRQLYNFEGYTPTAKGNSIGITGYLEEYANNQDLQTFYAEQRPDAVNSTYKYYSVHGGQNPQNLTDAGLEANLDVQFAFGIAHPIPATFWSTGGSPPFNPDVLTPTNTNEPYADWLDFVLGQKNPPLSISTSYGDDEQTVPRSYAKRACQSFAQLGARGVSLLFSSGDWGVGDNEEDPALQQCFTNDGTNRTRFVPIFPSTCPFVTSVGGTVQYPEVAVSRFYSGGGFSDYFERPSYQAKAVKKYLSKLAPGTYKDLYNPAGRGFPDVAAQSDRYKIYWQGRPVLIGGTSASSPAFAGIVALLNDARLLKGLPPLGFLNPLLYSSEAAATFNDITIGHNSGCGTTGFNATAGWDPVTGLGTPNFQKLKSVITKKKHH